MPDDVTPPEQYRAHKSACPPTPEAERLAFANLHAAKADCCKFVPKSIPVTNAKPCAIKSCRYLTLRNQMVELYAPWAARQANYVYNRLPYRPAFPREDAQRETVEPLT